MRLLIEGQNGARFVVDEIDPDGTIKQLKQEISKKVGITIDLVHLLDDRGILEDDRSLDYYGIIMDDCVVKMHAHIMNYSFLSSLRVIEFAQDKQVSKTSFSELRSKSDVAPTHVVKKFETNRKEEQSSFKSQSFTSTQETITKREILDDNPLITIRIDSSGRTYSMIVDRNKIIEELRQKISILSGVPADGFHLNCMGKRLDDCYTLAFYGIKNESCLHMLGCRTNTWDATKFEELSTAFVDFYGLPLVCLAGEREFIVLVTDEATIREVKEEIHRIIHKIASKEEGFRQTILEYGSENLEFWYKGFLLDCDEEKLNFYGSRVTVDRRDAKIEIRPRRKISEIELVEYGRNLDISSESNIRVVRY